MILLATAACWVVMGIGAYKIDTVVDIDMILPRGTELLKPFKLTETVLFQQFYPVDYLPHFSFD